VFCAEVEFASRKCACNFNKINRHSGDKALISRQAMQPFVRELATALDAMLVPRKMRAPIHP